MIQAAYALKPLLAAWPAITVSGNSVPTVMGLGLPVRSAKHDAISWPTPVTTSARERGHGALDGTQPESPE